MQKGIVLCLSIGLQIEIPTTAVQHDVEEPT